MNAPLHGKHGNILDLADDELAGMSLRCRAHETWYLFVRNGDRFFEVVGETAESTAEHQCNARLNADSSSDNPGSVFGAFVKTCACHSLNHLLLFLIRNA